MSTGFQASLVYFTSTLVFVSLVSLARAAVIPAASFSVGDVASRTVSANEYANLVTSIASKDDGPALGSSTGTVTVQTSTPDDNGTNSHQPMAGIGVTFNQSDINAIMYWVNYFDNEYALPQKNWSSHLAGNAQRTGILDGGVNETHHLFPGTTAQVIVNGLNLNDTQGYSYKPFNNFQAAYLDWLCEVPEPRTLHGDCPRVLAVTSENDHGQTDHNAILTSRVYTKIGCAFTYNPDWRPNYYTHGLWICDLS